MTGAAAGLRDRSTIAAYRAGAAVARVLPGPLAGLSVRAAGAVASQAMSDRRDVVARHLRRVHGSHLDGTALRRAVARSFESYARYWFEAFRLPSLTYEEIDEGFSYEGLGHLVDALGAGRGAVLAVPHLGNWDWAGAWFGLQGHRLLAVAERLDPPELFEWFVAARERLGITIVPLDAGAGTAVLRALRANDPVALICDRDIAGGGVEVEFFGERTRLPAGPATLSLRTGAPVLPTAAYFDGDGSHLAVVRPPIPFERTGKLRDDVVRLTQEIARELESLIRRAPEQWHLMQPNWPSDPGYGL